DYQAVVTDIYGVLAGLNATQTPPATISINAAGDPVDTADFGFAPSAGTGTIGDFVWLDFSGDGIQDAGEPGIEGVTLELWLDVNNDGVITPGVDNRVRTASTDANGEYLFSAVPAGNYLVQVTDDGGVLAGLTQTGDPDEGLVTCVICDELADITLLAGDNALAADFGYQTPVAASLSINGTVFEDADENQTYDSGTETPVAGAVVSLYRLVNGELVLWGTTTTDINGDYSFAGLPEGDYVVEVDVAGTTADGFSQTTQAASGGSQSVTLISATGDAVDQDFGFFDDAVITNPVTLRSFRTLRGPNPGDVAFEWSTATELGNVGFNLYAQQDGEWVVVNLQPIPSKVLDAVTVQQYSYQAYGVAGTEFILEDIDIKGQATRHGPFKLNRQYGQPQAKSKKIDWQKIRKEHESKKRMRKQNKGKRMQDKLERIKKRRVGVVSGARDTLLSMLLSMFVGTATAADLPPANSSLINFEVTEDGVHRVTYEDMRAAGLDLAGIDVDQISLTNLGESVPVRVEGAARKGPNSARKFGRGGYIEFIGEALDTLYTGTNVYELHIDDPNPARITADKAQPPRNAVPASFYMETVRVEDELLYSSSSPNGDPWYAAWMLAWGRTFQRDFSINIDQYAVGAAPVTLTVGMWGVTDWPDGSLDHHVKLSLNGVEVADEWFDGTVDHPVSVAVNGTVSEGANTVHVEMPLDTGFAFDVVSLDQYSLTYPRRFIANNGRLTFAATADKFRVENLPDDRVLVYRATAAGIQRLTKVVVSDNGGSYSAEFAGAATPATYHVVTQPNLSAVALTAPQAEVDLTAGVAEYLIITHPDFIGPELDLIVQQRQGRYSVKVVDVEDIYAQLNGHVVDANAIRDYIAFAQQNMNTRYVLLVGGDSYDYRDYLGLGTVSFVPSLYAQTDDLVRYAPVDALYADVDRDNVPDLAIGRFPVRNTAELSAIVNQTLVYEQKLYGKTAVFAADEFDIYQNYSFSDDSENMVDTHLTPRGWDVTRAYIDGEFGLGVQEARNTLIDSINNGVALTSFFGHSGTSDWTFAGLFNSNDAAALQNIGRPTVVTQWGCWNTYYVSPYEETLGHRFMLNADRGAAAVLGASTLTGAAAEHELADQVFSRIMEPGVTMGEAILNAKRAYAQDNPDQLDVILGWTQLGDPALVIQP
ncbi:MAG: C25 family cysteine peptidase, partial [Gammaproteobacteria bacterium]|nr:C25 family cysteine peptidase [Gammaproteobacteria bacterium]